MALTRENNVVGPNDIGVEPAGKRVLRAGTVKYKTGRSEKMRPKLRKTKPTTLLLPALKKTSHISTATNKASTQLEMAKLHKYGEVLKVCDLIARARSSHWSKR